VSPPCVLCVVHLSLLRRALLDQLLWLYIIYMAIVEASNLHQHVPCFIGVLDHTSTQWRFSRTYGHLGGSVVWRLIMGSFMGWYIFLRLDKSSCRNRLASTSQRHQQTPPSRVWPSLSCMILVTIWLFHLCCVFPKSVHMCMMCACVWAEISVCELYVFLCVHVSGKCDTYFRNISCYSLSSKLSDIFNLDYIILTINYTVSLLS
jgi:hypothetical protein